MTQEIARIQATSMAQAVDARSSVYAVGGMPPPDLLAVLQRRWRMVLVILAGSMLLGVGYYKIATPIYAGISRIYIQQIDPNLMRVGDPPERSSHYLDTQCELIKSTPVLQAVLDRPEVVSTRTLAGSEDPIAFLKQHLNVEQGKKDDLIEVSLESSSASEAAGIVNSVVTSYIDRVGRRKREMSAGLEAILQRELDQLKSDLTVKSRELGEFREKHGMAAFADARDNTLSQQLARLSESLVTAESASMEARSSYEYAQKVVTDLGKFGPVFDAQRSKGSIPFDREYEQLVSQLNEYELRLSTARSGVTVNLRAVASLQEYVDRLKEKLVTLEAKAAASYVAAAQQTWEIAQGKEKQIRVQYELLRQKASEMNPKAAEFLLLESDWHRLDRLTENLQLKIKDLRVAGDSGSLNVSVVEPARVELKPIKPRAALVLGIALVLGVVAGVGVAFFVEWSDQRIRSGNQAMALLGCNLMGVIPHVPKRRQSAASEPLSAVAEAYRTVRTNVYFSLRRQQARTLLITSPERGDGKSTLATGLAIAMAEAGNRVLLVDADLRLPVLHKRFSVGQIPGAAEVIGKTVKLEEAVRRTEMEHLDLLCSGAVPARASDMLGSQGFTEMLARCSAKYDYVLLDSPPLAHLTDSLLLGQATDATLIVLRAGKTQRRTAAQALRGLTNLGAHVIGLVLNDAPRAWDDYSYGYYPTASNGNGQAISSSNGQDEDVLVDIEEVTVRRRMQPQGAQD